MKGSSGSVTGAFAGRYTIERELGRGATAVVYLARDTSAGAVAIKVLREELLTEVSADRFLREIRVTAQLQHPNIVPVLDSGECDGRLYFVSQYMDGGTLRERLDREKQLPLDDVITIGKTIASALQFAHERELLHRDVKPENILFGNGQACLADFGIARALSASAGAATTTTAGVVRGTPAYMSPEQAAGDRAIDRRTDIYALGCVLYEAIAGVPAFVGPTQQSLVAQRLVHMPRSLRVYRPNVPPELEDVLERALATAPADRYQTAAEFVAALESVEPLLTGPSGGWRATESDLPVSRARRRNTWLLVGGIIAATLAAAAFVMTRRSPPPPGIPEGDPRRIAVMYLDDLTPDDLPTYLADGITEDLIDQLGGVRALRVISPVGVRPFRGKAVPIDSVARSLKVGTIISGSVARSGKTLRINTRIVDARTGQQLFSRSLEEQWTELFALQDKLAEQLGFFLRQRLGEEMSSRQHRAATKSSAAWETVQLASDVLRRAIDASLLANDSLTMDLYLRADSLFAGAEALDSRWVHPTIKRGRIALALAFGSRVPPNRADSIAYRRLTREAQHIVWIRRAMALAEDALRRDASSADGLVLRSDARFALMNADPSAADSLAPLIERDLRAALELRPDAAPAWSTLAQLARARGQFAEAAAAAKRAFEADAFFEIRRIVAIGFMAALHAGEIDDARQWCRMGLTHYAGDPRFTECELTLLGWTAASRSDVANAWRVLDDVERRDTLHLLAPTWGYRRLMVAAILARAGMTDSARHVFDAVRAAAPTDPQKRSTLSTEAYVQLLLGDRAAAIASLTEYLRATPMARAQIAQDPWFQALRGDPRFVALVQPR